MWDELIASHSRARAAVPKGKQGKARPTEGLTVAVQPALQHIGVLRKIVGELRAMEVTHAPAVSSGVLSVLTVGNSQHSPSANSGPRRPPARPPQTKRYSSA